MERHSRNTLIIIIIIITITDYTQILGAEVSIVWKKHTGTCGALMPMMIMLMMMASYLSVLNTR